MRHAAQVEHGARTSTIRTNAGKLNMSRTLARLLAALKMLSTAVQTVYHRYVWYTTHKQTFAILVILAEPARGGRNTTIHTRI